MLYLLIAIIFAVLGGVAVYFHEQPKIQARVQLDEKTAQENSKIALELNKLRCQKADMLNNIADLSQQAKEAGDQLYKTNYQLAENKFEAAAEKMSQDYQAYEEECKNEYLQVLEEAAKQFQETISQKRIEINSFELQLDELQSKVAAAVEASKRKVQMETEADFYTLNLSVEDIREIEKLRTVLPDLRDSEPLNKVIWKVYYEKPYTDLIGRVVGPGVHTGIYKITNLNNNMCYVGQAANISDRWRQHIKRGLGAETPTRNKLYPAMSAIGVENFSFEIIEECDRALLNEREDYWQEFYHAKDFGYSIK